MGAWWHFRQWVYARPPVAAAGAVVLLLIVGFSGWESARQFSTDEVAQTGSNVTYRVTVAKTVRVRAKNGRVVKRVIARTRTLDGATVRAKAALIVKTVRSVQTQRLVRNRTVTHVINTIRTVTQTRTQTLQSENRNGTPPGHSRPIVTVTVTEPVTVTVTTSKGH